MYVVKMKKTHFSTSVEGNVLSYNQVEKVIQNKNDKNRINAETEVKNYWDALTFLEEEKQKNTPISKEFILRLHDIIQRKNKLTRIPFRGQTPPGVLFSVYDSVTRQAEYIPLEYTDIEPLLDELITWYETNDDMPAPILAAIMLYALVSIHPFEDGNGRTSRALATYVLMQYNYDLKGFNCFEEYYMSDLEGYYKSIQNDLPPLFYSGRNNPPHLEIWIEYFLKIMSLNAENIYDQALEASNKNKNDIFSSMSKKDITLLRYCIENNIHIIKSKNVADLFSISNRSASSWLKNWAEMGLVEVATGNQRITSYVLTEKYRNLKASDLGFTDR